MCLVAVGTNYWRCGRSSQQSLAPESHPRLLVGKDRRLIPRIAAAPPSTTRATASQQSMSCMKHLVEAERESSVPSSNSKKKKRTSDGYSQLLCSRPARFRMTLDTNSVCHKAHRITQMTLLGDRTRAFTPGGVIGGWRGAVTSSSDQTKAETRRFYSGCQVKLAANQ